MRTGRVWTTQKPLRGERTYIDVYDEKRPQGHDARFRNIFRFRENVAASNDERFYLYGYVGSI